jgi:hypothetical protein
MEVGKPMTLRRLLEAPLADLVFEDIEALIGEEAEEELRFELKRELPAHDRQVDPWMQGGRKFADRALGRSKGSGRARESAALWRGSGPPVAPDSAQHDGG